MKSYHQSNKDSTMTKIRTNPHQATKIVNLTAQATRNRMVTAIVITHISNINTAKQRQNINTNTKNSEKDSKINSKARINIDEQVSNIKSNTIHMMSIWIWRDKEGKDSKKKSKTSIISTISHIEDLITIPKAVTLRALVISYTKR
jgi:hypothetical protein